MKQDLWNDLVKALDSNNNGRVGGALRNVLVRHGTKAQVKSLSEPVVIKAKKGKNSKVKNTGNTDVTSAPSSELIKCGDDAWSRTVRLNGYGFKGAAEADVAQLLDPNVFTYRAATFPNPKAYGITAVVTTARPVQMKPVKNPMAPWSIDMTVRASGAEAKVKSWFQAFASKIRIFEQ